MKVLLINPLVANQPRPNSIPLGLAYVGRYLLNNDHEVEVLDVNAYKYTQDQVVKKLKKLEYDVAGIGALSTQYGYVDWLSSQLKNIGKPVILGGALSTLSSNVILENMDVDYCVVGEGEHTIIDLVDNLDSPRKVRGIHYKEDGVIKKNPPRELIKDLDTIDFPARDLLPMDIYLKNTYLMEHTGFNRNRRVLTVITGRGCPYRCRFCSRIFKTTRMRSVDNILEEVKFLVEKYRLEGVFFDDELLVISKQRAYDLCDKIEKMGVKWQCQGRINIVDYPLLKRMKKAGCVAIGYGVESGSQKILDNMNKQITVEQANTVLKDTVRAGLYINIQMIFGYPGENRETIGETINFFKEIPYVGSPAFSILTPLPGTEVYDDALEEGLIKDEHEYLSGLEEGYHTERVLVNFTDFGDKEFHKMKNYQVSEIRRNYLMYNLFHRPWIFLKVSWGYINLITDNLKRNGFRKTAAKIYRNILGSG